MTFNVRLTWASTSIFLRILKKYYLPYCNLIKGIYYITTIGLVTNGGFHRMERHGKRHPFSKGK